MIQEAIEIGFDYDIEPIYLNEDMSNKLFCTFATQDTLDQVLEQIKERYKIIYNKIFILYSKSQDEYICTYNVDFGNVGSFLENTILVHRKKESNTLYTINALNECIKNLNNGVLDPKFVVPWENFKNTLMVTNTDGLNKISTRIYKIIKLEEI